MDVQHVLQNEIPVGAKLQQGDCSLFADRLRKLCLSACAVLGLHDDASVANLVFPFLPFLRKGNKPNDCE
ncbi:hypothetical protein NPIL_471181 [Nephila pilipes]|uniref:Uncharacterized protein n=1 Tax=Nephila pilipes TaxID=299642 RepID=A0A8X6T586_NEPPI|nr:hypothetical protein NPIL_471181 [Nephila pilipes]